MNGSTTLWIVLGIVALIIIAAVIYFATRKQAETRRSETSLRGQSHSQTDTASRRGKSATDIPESRSRVTKKTRTEEETRATRRLDGRDTDPPRDRS